MDKIEILIGYKHFSWLGFPTPGFMLYALREKFYTRWQQAYERVTTAENRARLELSKYPE
ncbi:hypothetical protein PRIPAC_75421 [Pristionchus pacificus]|uniref:Uncharacterized protein n=1 Tax=Pristionchus pacificus TaxID=54126 RepID=A0A2A6C0X2_PRIPA|nr:hypothetical protein PRIPAC_75421 [Pristionchus pacificus]|eukprot:PDM71681.1 hypothetical protein PRIPAC_38088 [Pristionchus pacificus]